MNKKKSCFCKLLEKIPKGRLVAVNLSSGFIIIFTYLKKIGNCIFGMTRNGGNIVFDCKDIMAISCSIPPCILLDNPSPISCTGLLTGRIGCGGAGLEGVIINLTSDPDIVNFANPTPITDEFGEFQTIVTIPTGTPVTNVTITATILLFNSTISNSITVTVDCLECINPILTLNVPESINCEGEISGTLTCDGEPIIGALVFFTVSIDDNSVAIFPNPVITGAGGTILTNIIVVPGTSGNYTITGTTTIGGQEISSGPFIVSIDCQAVECSCKANLGTAGSSQPNAVINVNGTVFTGSMNINVVECGASIGAPCNPNVDNFNFTFNASNGDTYQFTQGRRTSLTCEENIATLIGVIDGAINNGPKSTFMVTITASLDSVNDIITWTIFATDGVNTFQTQIPFVAASTPLSFIASCS